MSFILADRVQETTSTTGTGTVTLTGAVAQFRTFASGIGIGNLTYYALLDGNGVGWEIGSGTVGSGTLSRTTILASSNGGSAITLSAFGPHYVYSDAPAAAIQLVASVADSTILANISGSANPPTASTLTSIIDHTISSTQGVILYRDSSTWQALAVGTTSQFLRSGGAAANPSWQTAVTSVASGTGLTGGPITTTGTLSLATVTNNTVLANVSGITAAPTPNTVTAIIDTISSTQGVILYRDSSAWLALAVGTTSQFLRSGGGAANPSWQTAVTSVATGTGLTGGPITTTGTVSFAPIADQRILANVSGGSAAPVANTVTAVIDTISSTQGVILYRDSSAWQALAVGTASGQGQFLSTGGASANPAWATIGYTNLPSEIQKSLAQASIPGLIPINTKVMIIPIVMSMQIPANFAGSAGYCGTNATGSFAFTVSYIHSGSPSTIGTFTFSSGGGSTPALSTQALVNLVSGDIVIMTSASSGDGTLADVGLTLLMLKQ